MRRTLKQIAAEYGAVAVVVYLAIFAAVLLGSWAAIRLGWKPGSAGGGLGSFAAAYIATKLTQPLRIAATLALTPLAAKAYERMRPSVRRSGSVDPPTRAETPESAEPGQ
ncbi:MAG TPA: hypothetical protein VGO40_03845 [Longimicrobium sp.]|nr:hypothetical protein [Longimicrobium sp.]